MKIWKINCWRKVSLEMLCLVDEWIKHIKSYIRRIYWETQALTNQLINQTGTFGPVMLRRMKKTNWNMLWIAIISRHSKTESSKDELRLYQDISEEETKQLWIKITTSKMRLPLRFQANLGLINLLNQDFIKTLYTTRYKTAIREVEIRITIPLELIRKEKCLLKLLLWRKNMKAQGLLRTQEPLTSNRIK